MKDFTHRLLYFAVTQSPQEGLSEEMEQTPDQQRADETLARFMKTKVDGAGGDKFEAGAKVEVHRVGKTVEEGAEYYREVDDLLETSRNKSKEITDSLEVPGVEKKWVEDLLKRVKKMDLPNLKIAYAPLKDTETNEEVGYLAVCREKAEDNYRVFYRKDRLYRGMNQPN